MISFFSIVLVFLIANKQIGLVIAGVCWIIGSIISFVSAFGMKEFFMAVGREQLGEGISSQDAAISRLVLSFRETAIGDVVSSIFMLAGICLVIGGGILVAGMVFKNTSGRTQEIIENKEAVT